MILSPEECGCPLQDDGFSAANSQVCGGYFLFMVLLEGYIKGRCSIATPCERVQSAKNIDSEYDFVVVGGGTAGSIVAGRLSEVESFKILLLEAGGHDPIVSRIPSFYRAFWEHEELDWNYRTLLGPYCLDQGTKGCRWPRGKVLGGTNVLNGMMYHRGHEADYEDWVAAGAHGWSWHEIKHYFDKTENNRQMGSVACKENHAEGGPMPVQQFKYQPPFINDLLQAVNESGLPLMTDMNDPTTPEGFSIAQTMNQDGQRYTTARAYLKPNSVAPNLTVKMHAHVTQILFDGKKAVGIEFLDEDGQKYKVQAKKEVILSAGAINTPQILLLSGVGRPNKMKGTPLVANLPVGENLKNHIGLVLKYNLTNMNNTRDLDWNVLTKYLLRREGPMTADGITQVTGFLYSSLGNKSRHQPDLQFFFDGFYAECSKNGVIGELADDGNYGKMISGVGVSLLPKSVGDLQLNSNDPLDPPIINANYFSHPDDLIMVKDAAKYIRRIFESDILKNKYGAVLTGGSKCSEHQEWEDLWLECMIRMYTDPQNHQIGTAAIGMVVDTELKVYDIEGLRIIDASVIPHHLTGNPQGGIMMLAEKGAEMIKNRWMWS